MVFALRNSRSRGNFSLRNEKLNLPKTNKPISHSFAFSPISPLPTQLLPFSISPSTKHNFRHLFRLIMGRQRVYANAAERIKAFRERNKAQEKEASAPPRPARQRGPTYCDTLKQFLQLLGRTYANIKRNTREKFIILSAIRSDIILICFFVFCFVVVVVGISCPFCMSATDLFARRTLPNSLLKKYFQVSSKTMASVRKNTLGGTPGMVKETTKRPRKLYKICKASGKRYADELEAVKQIYVRSDNADIHCWSKNEEISYYYVAKKTKKQIFEQYKQERNNQVLAVTLSFSFFLFFSLFFSFFLFLLLLLLSLSLSLSSPGGNLQASVTAEGSCARLLRVAGAGIPGKIDVLSNSGLVSTAARAGCRRYH